MGAEINWGVRFNDNKDVGPFCFFVLYHCSTVPFHVSSPSCWLQAEHFLTNLCKEVSLRLQGCGVQGRTITLKVVSIDCTHFSFTHLYNEYLRYQLNVCLVGENKKGGCWRTNKVYGMR